MISQHIKDEVERIQRTKKEIAEESNPHKRYELKAELQGCYVCLYDVCASIIEDERKQDYIDNTTGKNTGG